MIHRQPDESGLREDRAIHSGHVALRRSEEHRTSLWRRPPGNQPFSASDHVFGKKLDRDSTSQGLNQRVNELNGQRLRRTESWLLGAIVFLHFVVGDEGVSV